MKFRVSKSIDKKRHNEGFYEYTLYDEKDGFIGDSTGIRTEEYRFQNKEGMFKQKIMDYFTKLIEAKLHESTVTFDVDENGKKIDVKLP